MGHLILSAFLAVSAVKGYAFGVLTPRFDDKEIISFFKGTIIVPPESSDYNPRPRNQIFYDNGTYKYFEYEDKSCRKTKIEVTVHWYVKDGILISTLNNGRILRDKVLAIYGDRIKLLSLDDGETFIRRKAAGC
jgi:hypothetical protein